jgi:hypothetical protein
MGYLQPGIDQWRYRPRGARSPVSAEPKLQEGKERRKLGKVVVVRRRRGTSVYIGPMSICAGRHGYLHLWKGL